MLPTREILSPETESPLWPEVWQRQYGGQARVGGIPIVLAALLLANSARWWIVQDLIETLRSLHIAKQFSRSLQVRRLWNLRSRRGRPQQVTNASSDNRNTEQENRDQTEASNRT